MEPLVISLIGSTGTGKSAVAFQLASKLISTGINNHCWSGVDLISADSRQVYSEIPITSGADVPQNWQQYQSDNSFPWLANSIDSQIKLFGVSFLMGNEPWSVSQFSKLVEQVIDRGKTQNRATIIVGGTGMYHQQLISSGETLLVKPSPKLRIELEKSTLSELQTKLQQCDPKRWQTMNHSDQCNPRRLIRAIEVSLNHSQPSRKSNLPSTFKTFLLSRPNIDLKQIIQDRVKKRWQQGCLNEIKNLLIRYSGQKLSSLPIFSTHGIDQMSKFLNHQIDEVEMIESWTRDEYRYSRQQELWWRKFTHQISLVENDQSKNSFAQQILDHLSAIL